ncbi:hypothetical protein LTR81_028148, partial [Elasticomyces elasticus]
MPPSPATPLSFGSRRRHIDEVAVSPNDEFSNSRTSLSEAPQVDPGVIIPEISTDDSRVLWKEER